MRDPGLGPGKGVEEDSEEIVASKIKTWEKEKRRKWYESHTTVPKVFKETDIWEPRMQSQKTIPKTQNHKPLGWRPRLQGRGTVKHQHKSFTKESERVLSTVQQKVTQQWSNAHHQNRTNNSGLNLGLMHCPFYHINVLP